MILIFDTETNGLPKNYKAPCTDVDNWPRITQLGFTVRYEDGTVHHSQQALIKPNGWLIPTVHELTVQGNKDPEFFARNNMSTERCEKEGVEISEVFQWLLHLIPKCHTIVAHNLDFDLPVLQAELIRAGFPHQIELEQICTMKLSTDICQIPGPYGFKWPSLTELVAWCGGTMQGAHDALNDAEACADCYFELKKRGLLQPKPTTAITYSNVTRYDRMPGEAYFKLPGYSHSWLKREKNGVVEPFNPTRKMLLGSLVDAFLTEPDRVKVTDPNYTKAKIIATCIKNNFGSLIERFIPQVSYTATMHYNGLRMDTQGRLDWLLPRHAVIDLKFTAAASIKPIIEYFGYKNQLWNYAKMAGVKKAYIISYSDETGECEVTQIDVTSEYNEFWASSTLKHGKF